MSASFSPKLKKWLVASGCRFVRQAKGDHEIWYSPLTQRRSSWTTASSRAEPSAVS